ncbi:hypothetical protein DSO57_1037896 [Entomophthora muscae]|uniref:Uncharacterized protein n=1 Tax=Entomophthora muscae TaxID=34485 RepID=A0ACC2SC00_9FUNG|nr:hypothetical protein DSO57_1037896 [Entomophthora muscae]
MRQGEKRFTDTEGNNVIAGHLDTIASTHPGVDGESYLVFDFPLNLKKEPESYLNASITNLFYWCNTHDLYYRYGFDEAAGNFQENNFGRGGGSDDAVVASAQDADGYDNANFATPPDGQRPRMNIMYGTCPTLYAMVTLKMASLPRESAHGLSTRLTGGPANSDCLGWGEAGVWERGGATLLPLFYDSIQAIPAKQTLAWATMLLVATSASSSTQPISRSTLRLTKTWIATTEVHEEGCHLGRNAVRGVLEFG